MKMGCGSSTDSLESESKASLGTAHSSRASSGTSARRLKNKARVAPEVFLDNGKGNSGIEDGSCRAEGNGVDLCSLQTTQTREPSGSGDEVTYRAGVVNNNNHSADKETPVKSVAFEVVIDDTRGDESILKKHPPRRLQKLENAPRPAFTLNELEEQQRKSAERRIKALEGRKKGSKMSSRRRNELLAAVKFSEEHQQQVTAKKLEEKIDSASKNREKHQADVIRKQRLLEERAQQAEERRRRASVDEEINYDVEKDETFNADDDVDSWLDGDNNNELNDAPYKGSASTAASERIYDGCSSPSKQIHDVSHTQRLQPLMDSDESETEAFSARIAKVDAEKDDFFD